MPDDIYDFNLEEDLKSEKKEEKPGILFKIIKYFIYCLILTIGVFLSILVFNIVEGIKPERRLTDQELMGPRTPAEAFELGRFLILLDDTFEGKQVFVQTRILIGLDKKNFTLLNRLNDEKYEVYRIVYELIQAQQYITIHDVDKRENFVKKLLLDTITAYMFSKDLFSKDSSVVFAFNQAFRNEINKLRGIETPEAESVKVKIDNSVSKTKDIESFLEFYKQQKNNSYMTTLESNSIVDVFFYEFFVSVS